MDPQHTAVTRVCPRCRQEKPLTNAYYGYDKRRSNGFQCYCKTCRLEAERTRRVRNPEVVRAQQRRAMKALRIKVLSHYSDGAMQCACCGESRYEFLAIDHVDGGGHKHRMELFKGKRAGTRFYSWLHKANYPTGYQILCHNCNMAKGFWGECPHEKERGEATL